MDPTTHTDQPQTVHTCGHCGAQLPDPPYVAIAHVWGIQVGQVGAVAPGMEVHVCGHQPKLTLVPKGE